MPLNNVITTDTTQNYFKPPPIEGGAGGISFLGCPSVRSAFLIMQYLKNHFWKVLLYMQVHYKEKTVLINGILVILCVRQFSTTISSPFQSCFFFCFPPEQFAVKVGCPFKCNQFITVFSQGRNLKRQRVCEIGFNCITWHKQSLASRIVSN